MSVLPISRAIRPHLRTINRSWIIRSRFNSSRSSSRDSVLSHLAAGLAGGAVVLAAGYGIYHYSGAKKVVDASQSVASAVSFYMGPKERAKTSSNIALAYLRGVAKSYVAIIPGADILVDRAFNSVDGVVEAHSEEAGAITNRAFTEVKNVLARNGDKDNVDTASRVMAILKRMIDELGALGGKVGGNAMSPIWDHYPEIRESIGGGLKNLGNMVKDKGPGAKKLFDDAQQQVRNIFSHGSGDDGPKKARHLIEDKKVEIQEEVGISSEERKSDT